MNGEAIQHAPQEPISRRYQLTDQLAWHELSVTYRARDLHTGSWVALRRLRSTVALGSSAMRRFEREFELLSTLRHPAVVRALDYDWDDEGPFYTTEYVEGRELITVAPLHWRVACLNLRRLASALGMLHTRGILHGRLSPSRVLVGPGGAWKLAELSTAVPVGATSSLGGAYGAPEATTACLDARADVYSLGALAFFVLSGEHLTVPRAGTPHVQVPRVSSVVRDVPAALDELLRSMVQVDRDVRPANMAEVIVRLSAIGQLEPEPAAIAVRIADSYLATPPVLGQQRALGAITEALTSAEHGRGKTLQLVGEGAARIVEETVRLARFGRWEVLRLGALEQATDHESPHDSMIRKTALGSHARLDLEQLVERLGDATQRPLLIAVENLHHCSQEHLESYCQLAQRVESAHAMLLLTGVPDQLAGEHDALRILRGGAVSVGVEPLRSEQTTSLVQSLFGDVPRCALAARWLHDAAAGNAARVVKLARELVKDGSARYLDGAWVLPTRRPRTSTRERTPRHMPYPEGAPREALTALALLRTPPELALARSLLAYLQPGRDLLSLLLQERLLIDDGGMVRFSSRMLRDALREEPLALRRALHRRLAEAWLAHSSHSWCNVEASWHLLEAGESEHAVLMLARTAATAPLMHVARPSAPWGEVFAAALRACPARSTYLRMALLSGLVHAGLYEDSRWYRKYADETIGAFERVTGFGMARRLRPMVGAPLALIIASVVTALRFWFTPSSQRVRSLAGTYEHALITKMALLGAAAGCLDLERAQQIARVLEPLKVLRDRETVRIVLRLAEGLKLLASDSPGRSHAALREVIDTLADPTRCSALSSPQRATLAAGAHYACGLLAVHRLRMDAAEQSADYLARTGMPLFVSVAGLIRQLTRAHRGEVTQAEVARRALEHRFPDLGANWQRTPWEQASLVLPALSSGDLLALRQLAESLQALSREVPSLVSYQRLASKASRFVEESLDDSLQDPKRALRLMSAAQHEGPVFEQRALIGSARLQSTLASLMNAAGCHREAADTCAKALARMEPGDEEFTAFFLELELQHALAQSGLGEEREALVALDRLLERVRDSQHPLVLGRVHEVRALVALEWSRGASFQRELALAERWYRSAANVSSLARIERLAFRAGDARHELAALPAPLPMHARTRA
ncbi:MAG: serine/threonine-protein kinase [Polyangiales bacterium]